VLQQQVSRLQQAYVLPPPARSAPLPPPRVRHLPPTSCPMTPVAARLSGLLERSRSMPPASKQTPGALSPLRVGLADVTARVSNHSTPGAPLVRCVGGRAGQDRPTSRWY